MGKDSIIISSLLVVIVSLIGVIFVLALDDKKEEQIETETETKESVVSKDKEKAKPGDVVTYTITDENGNKMYFSYGITESKKEQTEHTPYANPITKEKTTSTIITVGETGLTAMECYKRDSGKLFFTSDKDYKGYYTYCYRVACSNGKYKYDRFAPTINSESKYTCANGNKDPYIESTSDGCSKTKEGKSCSNDEPNYCTKVLKIDCNKTSDKKAYTSTKTKETIHRPTNSLTVTGTSTVSVKIPNTVNVTNTRTVVVDGKELSCDNNDKISIANMLLAIENGTLYVYLNDYDTKYKTNITGVNCLRFSRIDYDGSFIFANVYKDNELIISVHHTPLKDVDENMLKNFFKNYTLTKVY